MVSRLRTWKGGALYLAAGRSLKARAPATVLLAVPREASGQRLDAFLSDHLPSRTVAQRLIEGGRARVDGRKAGKSSTRLSGGELIQIVMPRVGSVVPQPEPLALDVLFEDDDIIVLNKAKGMVVHPAPGNRGGTLVNALLHHCGEALSLLCGTDRPGIIHRLDKDTSGCLVAVKTDLAYERLGEQLRSRTMERVYIALVHGAPPDRGLICAPIGRHPLARLRMAVLDSGKPATTRFRVLERLAGYSLVEVRLETGRTHQIRVHMAHIGHPVVGDVTYGPKRPHLVGDGQALHAWRVSFTHPRSGARMSFTAPLPPSLLHALAMLRAARA